MSRRASASTPTDEQEAKQPQPQPQLVPQLTSPSRERPGSLKLKSVLDKAVSRNTNLFGLREDSDEEDKQQDEIVDLKERSPITKSFDIFEARMKRFCVFMQNSVFTSNDLNDFVKELSIIEKCIMDNNAAEVLRAIEDSLIIVKLL